MESTNLSAKDPYFILPVLIGVSMIAHSASTSTDPRQKLSTYAVALLFAAFSAGLPAGLSLFIFVSAVTTVLQTKFYTLISKERKDMDQLQSLKLLLKHLQQVPYLASKNLYRVAIHFLDMDDQRIEQFCDPLPYMAAKQNIIKCEKCFTWKERAGQCLFCDSQKRDQSIVWCG